MEQIKLAPFDLDKAKNGAKIVTKVGYPVRITCYDVEDKDLPILAVIKNKEGKEIPYQFTIEGNFYINKDEHPFDLFIEEEQEKTRRTYSGTDSIYVPKDDAGIREELIDAINGLWNDDALPMPLSIKRKDAWLAWLDNKPKFKVDDKVVLKCNNSCVGSIADVSLEGTYCVKFEDSKTGWYSEHELLHKVEKVKSRRMTQQELSWWLRECPEEHREYRHKEGSVAYFDYYYCYGDANKPVADNLLIRKNGGEWVEPLIEE